MFERLNERQLVDRLCWLEKIIAQDEDGPKSISYFQEARQAVLTELERRDMARRQRKD